MSDGLSGDRNPLVVGDVKYQLAQAIIDKDTSTVTYKTHKEDLCLCHNEDLCQETERLFGGIGGAGGNDDFDLEYMRVFGSIIYDPV